MRAENSLKLTTIVTWREAWKEIKLKGGISISASLFPGKNILTPVEGEAFRTKLDFRLFPFPTASSKKLNQSGENPEILTGNESSDGNIGFSIGTGGRRPRQLPLNPSSKSNPSQKCKKCTVLWVNSSKSCWVILNMPWRWKRNDLRGWRKLNVKIGSEGSKSVAWRWRAEAWILNAAKQDWFSFTTENVS